MRFRPFGHNSDPDEQGPGGEPFGAWRDSGLADEVVAFLAGRVVEHCAAQGRPGPPWAALNRLADADRSELLKLVTGGVPSCAQGWATTERFVAARVLAQAPTQDRLEALQSQVLVPVELRLIERCDADHLSADEVLEAAAQALDTFAG